MPVVSRPTDDGGMGFYGRTNNGEGTGHAIGMVIGSTATLDTLHVSPHFARQGWGAALWEAFLHWARGCGAAEKVGAEVQGGKIRMRL